MSGDGLIVVGVDGSEPARIALDFALEEAARRSARVLVVTALQPPEYWPLTSGVAYAPSRDQLEKLVEAAEQATRETVAEAVRATDAAVPVTTRVVQGNPARVLLDQAVGADLLVVGHRGRGAVASACLGSVSLQCVLYADCPVVVVRQTRAAADGAVLSRL
jgi:nucleotide-binding universal stress UspA family protein